MSEPAKGWQLLVQVDSEARLGLEIGDVETLRVFARSTSDPRKVRASTSDE